ncbi:MAG: hypothetical protein HFJ45_02740 [Clostridia bacterium]|nr:hypothetical protein [Clostridia bacterium]
MISQMFNFENIKNSDVKCKLEDMYFQINNTSNSIYKIVNITDERIFLTDTKEGGNFSISKEIYPDFNKGDLLKKENGKYLKI